MFRAEAAGHSLEMDNAGLAAGNEIFKDRETGSVWQQATLTAISGPLRGVHLKLYHSLLTSWHEWRRLHPDTLVLKPLPGYAERIASRNEQIREGYAADAPVPAGVVHHDDRLKPHARVLGLDLNGASQAIPLDVLQQVKVVNEDLGGQPVLIVHQPDSETTTAFLTRVKGKRLTFDAATPSASELIDRETRSRWTAYGACVAGPLEGTRLEEVALEPEYWFAWSEFHPDTTLFTPNK